MNTRSKKIVVCFPVRNEQKHLPKVLDSLVNQSIKPVKVIIANDGSTDQTEEIAKSYDFVEVINRPPREKTVVGKIEMAKVWNDSIYPAKKINEDNPIDYILFLGGDIVLSETYLEQLSKKFEQNNKLMIAAGTMKGEYAYKSTGFMIPGPGRMMRYDYWMKLGGEYPLLQGWEAYPVYKANKEGYITKIFEDIEYYPLRPTGERTDYRAYGEAMRALGYFWVFALGRIVKQPFMQGRGIKSAIDMFKGYFFGKPELYDKELRNFVKKSQKQRIKKILNPF